MPKYKVLLVRRTIDDCWVEVDAIDETDAVDKAYDEVDAGAIDWQNQTTDEVWTESVKELEPYDPREEPDYE